MATHDTDTTMRAPIAKLNAIFRPRSVAVIGASTRRHSIGRLILHNLIMGDFHGKLFPVNPKADYIHSIKAYPSIQQVPDDVDLAVVVVPAGVVEETVRQCGEKGVSGLVIITAGFREIGGEGAEREKRVVELCRHYGMRVVGPNCLGVFNADPKFSLNATFAPGVPLVGPLGMVSQSGALGVAIWTEMQRNNVGFSQFVSIGNKADVTGNDMLEYWESDPHTALIALYIESFGDAMRFNTLARRITRKKPVLMVKSGRTAAGARAASSHTGALSGTDRATDALINQTGVIRARTIDEMMAMILAFSRCAIPKGSRVSVLTNAGGPAIMATDALVGHGLELSPLSDETRAKLQEHLPVEASVANPVDMIASANSRTYGACTRILLEAEETDIVIVAFVPPLMVNPMEIVRAVTEEKNRIDKPVLMVLMAEEQYYDRIALEIPDSPPIYRYPETAALASAKLVHHARWTQRDEGSVPTVDADRETTARILESEGAPGEYLDPDAAFRLLEAYRFPLVPWRRVHNAEEAVAAADELGYPAVLKVGGRRIVHKSDVGGVIMNIKNALEMEGAFGKITRAVQELGHDPEEDAFLVQPLATPGREVILGMNTDSVIGPVILFGMGGKYVEVFRDTVLRIPPITDVDAREMVESIRGYPLLQGVRGDEPVALPVIYRALHSLSALVRDFPQIGELDLNPFLLAADAEHCRIVDARIRLRN